MTPCGAAAPPSPSAARAALGSSFRAGGAPPFRTTGVPQKPSRPSSGPSSDSSRVTVRPAWSPRSSRRVSQRCGSVTVRRQKPSPSMATWNVTGEASIVPTAMSSHGRSGRSSSSAMRSGDRLTIVSR